MSKSAMTEYTCDVCETTVVVCAWDYPTGWVQTEVHKRPADVCEGCIGGMVSKAVKPSQEDQGGV